MLTQQRASRLLLLLTGVAVLLSGCWGYRDVESFAVVQALGIDVADEQDRVKVTAQFQRPMGQGESGGEGGSGSTYWTIGITGYSVSEALRNFRQVTGRRLLLTQMEAVIFGEELAKRGIRNHIDYFLREPNVRLRTLLVTAEGEASTVLDIEHKLADVPAQMIRTEVEGIASIVIERDARQTSIAMYNETTDIVMGKISAINDDEQLFLSAGAIFRDDKLVQFLTRKEARGVNWVLQPSSALGIVILEPPGLEGDSISVEVVEAKSKMGVELKDDTIRGFVEIQAVGNVVEVHSPRLDLSVEENLESLDPRLAQVINNEVVNAIAVTQQNRSDIFGFGESLRRQYPQEYTKRKDNWYEVFSTMEIDVRVKAHIGRAGLLI